MKDITNSFYYLLTGISSNQLKDFDDIARFVRAKDFYERRIEGKVFLVALTTMPAWERSNYNIEIRPSIETLETVARKGSYKLCRETVRRIVDLIGSEYGLERRKTSTERVRDILEDITINRDLEDMRATLLIIQKESQHLKEQFDEEVQNHNQEFIRNFFIRMNSIRHGELLDSISQTDFLIQDLQRQGKRIEPELQAIPALIQLFVNFLYSEGVSPIETIGEIRTLQLSQLVNYEFIGSPNLKADGTVDVIIKTSGWKFGDILISKPTVEEISV